MNQPAPASPRLCGACGYDVTGVLANACPECGASPLVLAPVRPSIWKSWWLAFVVCGGQVLGFAAFCFDGMFAGKDPFAQLLLIPAVLPLPMLGVCLLPAMASRFMRHERRRRAMARSTRLLWHYLLAIYALIALVLLFAFVSWLSNIAATR